MPSSCKDIRTPLISTPHTFVTLHHPTSPKPLISWRSGAALASCLASSDCILIERHTALECLRPPLLETLPTQCQQLKQGYGQCKRGMVDMRKRFRGNMPISTSLELQGEGKGQLYAGRPALGEQKATEGREDQEGEMVQGVDGVWRAKEK